MYLETEYLIYKFALYYVHGKNEKTVSQKGRSRNEELTNVGEKTPKDYL